MFLIRYFAVFALVSLLCLSALAQAEECTPKPIIDMHLHYYTEDTFRGPAPNPVTGEMGPATKAEHEAQMKEMLAEHQIVLGLASAPLDWENPDPERLWHSYTIYDPEKLDMEGLRPAVEAGRVRAIGELGAQYEGVSPADERWNPLYALADEHSLPVAVHTGGGPPGVVYRNRPDFRFEYGNPYLLQDVLVKRPDLKVYLMHAGLPPWGNETLAMMDMYGDLYIDTGVVNWYMPFLIDALEDLLKEAFKRGYGKRVMFGSDQMIWPDAVPMAIATIRNADYLTEEQKRNIFFDNAADFLGLDEKERATLIERACSS